MKILSIGAEVYILERMQRDTCVGVMFEHKVIATPLKVVDYLVSDYPIYKYLLSDNQKYIETEVFGTKERAYKKACYENRLLGCIPNYHY